MTSFLSFSECDVGGTCPEVFEGGRKERGRELDRGVEAYCESVSHELTWRAWFRRTCSAQSKLHWNLPSHRINRRDMPSRTLCLKKGKERGKISIETIWNV